MALECVSLENPATGATAKVLAGFGFNCYEFRVQHQGRPIDVLWSADGFETGQERPSGSGTPILFPFPGRIAGTVFRWKGREYPLEAGDGRGNAIHGFVLNRAWRVIDQSSSKVVGQFQASQDVPELLARWPADFRITVSYELTKTGLDSRILVENPDDKPLPCGLGTHPYFRLPLGGARSEDCRIRLPVTQEWELHEMLPTGKRLAVPDAEAYQAGLKFAEVQMDNVFTGLSFDDSLCRASIADPESGMQLRLVFDRTFRECVVYTPPHREAICIEPYTCLAGAFSLSDSNLDTGMRVLQPGQSFAGQIRLEVGSTQ